MNLIKLTSTEASEAVRRYDSSFGEMELVLGCLGMSIRKNLKGHNSQQIAEALVWTLKSWWGVQGVRKESKAMMASALLSLPISENMLEVRVGIATDAATIAAKLVKSLVEHTCALGCERKEVSLASKVLHWVLPWHVPVFDSFVCKELGVSIGGDPLRAYAELAQLKVAAAASLASWESNWLGNIPPRSLLRALDKCLWWQGGGDSGKAVVVRNPWAVINELGIARKSYSALSI